MNPPDTALATGTLAAETIDLCSRLIRFDTSNFGAGDCRGEREAAEFVAEQLTDVGYDPVVLEAAPRRASTVVRIPGRNREAPALLVHGHLDVVPTAPADWTFDPFCGDVRDGAIWGRGALDMKDMDAMMLAVASSFGRRGFVPPRDIVMAFVADEEDTGELGAGFLVREHRDLFEGVQSAIGESGADSIHLPDDSRLYAIATGERGSAWMNLTASGPAGHGSRHNPDGAVAVLVGAMNRLAEHDFPVRLTPPVAALVEGLEAHLGVHVDPADPASLTQLGAAAKLISATLANTINPTMLSAGYKHNVIPSDATGGIDGRILPGTEDEFFATVDALLGDTVTREFVSYAAPVSTGHDTAEFAAMATALRAHDPEALVLPFCMAGGTDAKAFAGLGIACYGFTPGRTPSGFDTSLYVHGVDERVLIDSLAFGVGVLESYLQAGPRPVTPPRPTVHNRAP